MTEDEQKFTKRRSLVSCRSTPRDWVAGQHEFFFWIVLSVCILASNTAVSAENRLIRVAAEIMVSPDGQVGSFAIYDDTPDFLLDIFRDHLKSLTLSGDDVAVMPDSVASAEVVVYFRLSEDDEGNFAVFIDDQKILFKTYQSIPGGDNESEVTPIVRINPKYPMAALDRGVSGWVELEFTITAKGTVKDIEITRASHKRLFGRAAKRAIARWKFRPRMIDGVAVERRATQVIEFQMEPAD